MSGEKPLIPWVVVITEDSGEYIKNLLKDEAYFGLTEGQVKCLYIILLFVDIVDEFN